MSLPSPSASPWTACPHCGLPVARARIVCNGCGCVMPIETMSRRLRGALPRLAAAIWRRMPVDGATALLWLLACMPLLIAPPLCALALCWLRASQHRGESPDGVRINWVALVAAANVILSVAFWLIAARHMHDLAGAIWDSMTRFRLPLWDDSRPRIFRADV